MSLRDIFARAQQSLTPDLLDPLLKSAGIAAARLEYDPTSRQVILALKIHGQARYLCVQAGRTYSRAEICALIAAAPAPAPPIGDSERPPG